MAHHQFTNKVYLTSQTSKITAK